MSRDVGVVAVNDAYMLLPFADVLYACDAKWWDVHRGAAGFAGEKWSSHGIGSNDKLKAAERWGLKVMLGAARPGFSFGPGIIHYGSNSGFQAVNLALQLGATRIVLVGFDMRPAGDGRRHFFGDHPPPLRNPSSFDGFIRAFEEAAKLLPPYIEIRNATPGSALECFASVNLAELSTL